MLVILAIIVSIASVTMASKTLAEESTDVITQLPHGHVQDIDYIKQVSDSGAIQISKLSLSVVNDDDKAHSFQVCATMKGFSGLLSPSAQSEPACTDFESIEPQSISQKQIIDFKTPLLVSDLQSFSLSIEEK